MKTQLFATARTHLRKSRRPVPVLRTILLCVELGAIAACAQGTALTYQGRLNDAAGPANGWYDFQFTVRDALTGGSPVGAYPLAATLALSNGQFTATLDPGAGVFTGADRWLEIAVRTNGGGAFTTFSPRQKITATPYAITAGTVTGTVSAGQLSGTITPAQIPNLDASKLTTGTLADARLSTNVARRSGGNTFSGNQVFTNGNVGIGTTNPASRLDVVGAVRATSFLGDGSGLTGVGARAYTKTIRGTLGIPVGVATNVGSMQLPAGNYLVTGQVQLVARRDLTIGVVAELYGPNGSVARRDYVLACQFSVNGVNVPLGTETTLTLHGGVRLTQPGMIWLSCFASETGQLTYIHEVKFTAISVDQLQMESVQR